MKEGLSILHTEQHRPLNNAPIKLITTDAHLLGMAALSVKLGNKQSINLTKVLGTEIC